MAKFNLSRSWFYYLPLFLILYYISFFSIKYPGTPIHYPLYTLIQNDSTNYSELSKLFSSVNETGYGMYFISNNNYFQNNKNQVYYLGRKNKFKGKYVVNNFNNLFNEIKVSFYLDMKPVEVQFGNHSIKDTSTIYYSFKKNNNLKINLNLDSIKIGRHILSIIIRPIGRKDSIYEGENLFKKSIMKNVQLVRIKNENDIFYDKPIKKYTITKDTKKNFHCFYKNGKVAVFNNSKKELEGVFFNSYKESKPLYYKFRNCYI